MGKGLKMKPKKPCFRRRLEVEELEALVLLNGTWNPLGPMPQLFGQQDFDGNLTQPVTGNISVLAIGKDNSANGGQTALFAGADSGGLWRSTNFTSNNPTWTSLTDNAVSVIDPQSGLGAGSLNLGPIAVDPTNPKRIFFGTVAAN